MKYLLVLLLLFTVIVIAAKELAQIDGVLRDRTLVVRHLEA